MFLQHHFMPVSLSTPSDNSWLQHQLPDQTDSACIPEAVRGPELDSADPGIEQQCSWSYDLGRRARKLGPIQFFVRHLRGHRNEIFPMNDVVI